jgi:hypothetical protein
MCLPAIDAKRAARAAVVAVAALLLSASAASACSCSRVSRAETIAASQVAFAGVVRGVRVSPDGKRQLASVRITERIKGRLSDTMTVTTSRESSLCGYPMEAGKTYRFAGAPKGGQLEVDLCVMFSLNGPQ